MGSCCIAGERPQNFPWDYRNGILYGKYRAAMAEMIVHLIGKGYTHFVTRGTVGADMDAAEAVIALKATFSPTLEVAVPHRGILRNLGGVYGARLSSILGGADSVRVLAEEFSPLCVKNSGAYAVDRADAVLVFWNGKAQGETWELIRYAELTHKRLLKVYLNELC